jgi:hypothetical protein
VLQVDTFTDLAGSLNFVLLTLLTYGMTPGAEFHNVAEHTDRQNVATAIALAARLFLAAFLFYRVLKRSKDARFDETRNSFVRFLIFWVFQMVWVWCVSLPVVFLNTEPTVLQPGNSSERAGSFVGDCHFILLRPLVGDLLSFCTGGGGGRQRCAHCTFINVASFCTLSFSQPGRRRTRSVRRSPFSGSSCKSCRT